MEVVMDGQKPQVKFDLSFTPEVDKYIEIYKKQGKVPTVAGFANRIGTDEQSIYAWADKKKKDENGNLTDEYARPNFRDAIKRLEEASKQAEEKKEEQNSELNEKQELFCQLYASDREFFANGTESYIEAYGIDTSRPGAYNSARSSASRLLTDVNILKRINEILEGGNLNDSFVDKQLEFVITQNADFSSKIAAIREYNKLKTRIIDRIDHTTKGKEMPTPIYGGKSE